MGKRKKVPVNWGHQHQSSTRRHLLSNDRVVKKEKYERMRTESNQGELLMPTKKTWNHLPFNMIEIVIALMIIMTVLVSIVALLPKGIEANRDALSRIAAADAADQFFNQYSAMLQQDWNYVRKLPTSKPDLSQINEQELTFSNENVLNNEDLEIHFAAPSASTSFAELNEAQATGIFKIRHRTASNKTDFTATMAVWAEFPDLNIEGAPAELGDAAEVRIKAEISWPASVKYEHRQKKIYEYQVYRPDLHGREANSMFEVPCKSAWAIEQGTSTPRLMFYVMSSESSTNRVEGEIQGLNNGVKVDAMTIVSDGTIFFINNASGEGSSTLYRINPGEIDHVSSTPVNAIKVGSTGLEAGSYSELTGMIVVGQKLYAVTRRSKELYEVNPQTAQIRKVSDIEQSGSFEIGAMTVATSGVYLSRIDRSKTEIWK
ncbi:MAG: hypothetical protein D6820_18415, partial [Lentisphaerae bacterium]